MQKAPRPVPSSRRERPSPRRPLRPAAGSAALRGCRWPLSPRRRSVLRARGRCSAPGILPGTGGRPLAGLPPAVRALPSPALSLCASPRSSRQTAISLDPLGKSGPSGSCLGCFKATDKRLVAMTIEQTVSNETQAMERRDEKEGRETVFSGTEPKSRRAMTEEGRSFPTWRL